MGEEEERVFDSWTANGRAEHVTDELSPLVWLSTREFRCLQKIVVCRERRVPVVFVKRPVELVRPAFGHECYLRTGGTSGIRVGVARGDAKIGNGILRVAQHASECEAVVLVVDVDTVQRDVGLIAASAVHG